MKTDRHYHKPQSDVARDAWSDAVRAIQPYTRLIVALVIAVVAVFVLVRVFNQRAEQRERESWAQLMTAVDSGDPDALQEVATNYPNTSAAGWALQRAGDAYLQMAVLTEMFDRATARENYREARESYEQARDIADEELLEQRTLLGLAQAYQGLNDLEKAEATYRTILERWPGRSVAELARSRLEFVQQPSTQAFYEWYLKQKPSMPAAPVGDATGPEPSPYDDLPDIPSLSLPEASELTRPGGDVNFGPVMPPAEATVPSASDLQLPLVPADNVPADNVPADNVPADNVPAEAPGAAGDDAQRGDVPPADPGNAEAEPNGTPPAGEGAVPSPPAESPPEEGPPAESPPGESPPAESTPAEGPATPDAPAADEGADGEEPAPEAAQ